MKRPVLFISLLLLIFSFAACSFTIKQKDGTKESIASEATDSDRDTETTAPSPSPQDTSTIKSSESISPSPTIEPPKISNEILQKNMMKADSYRRRVKYVSTPPPTAGGPIDVSSDEAYIKSPFAAYMCSESAAFNSRNENLIIDNTLYERKDKNEKWMRHEPGDFGLYGAPPFQYALSPMFYPINYEKLSPEFEGTENVNGVDCSKFSVSGSYTEDITLYEGTEYEKVNTITLSAEGTLWVSNDNAIGPVMIRQRITVKRDIEDKEYLDFNGKPSHFIADEVIEDDLFEINSVKLTAPLETDTVPYVAETPMPEESQPSEEPSPQSNPSDSNFTTAEQREAGPVTKEQAEPWTRCLWNTDQGYMVFEWINGYVVGFSADEEKNKIFIENQHVGVINGDVMSGDFVIMGDHGTFEIKMDESGKSFSGNWKFDISTDWPTWSGTSVEN